MDVDLRICLALAGVGRDVILAAEHLEGRVSLNAICLAELSLLCAVDLDKSNVLLLQGGGGLLVLGGESLAVAAVVCNQYPVGRLQKGEIGRSEAYHQGAKNSARTRSFDAMNSSKLSVLSCATSEAETAAAAASRLRATFLYIAENCCDSC